MYIIPILLDCILFKNFDFILCIQIAKLQSLDSSESELNWTKGFNLGRVVEGRIQETKDVGVVVSFDKYNDVLGFITHYQCKSFPFLAPPVCVVSFGPITCSGIQPLQ